MLPSQRAPSGSLARALARSHFSHFLLTNSVQRQECLVLAQTQTRAHTHTHTHTQTHAHTHTRTMMHMYVYISAYHSPVSYEVQGVGDVAGCHAADTDSALRHDAVSDTDRRHAQDTDSEVVRDLAGLCACFSV